MYNVSISFLNSCSLSVRYISWYIILEDIECTPFSFLSLSLFLSLYCALYGPVTLVNLFHYFHERGRMKIVDFWEKDAVKLVVIDENTR